MTEIETIAKSLDKDVREALRLGFRFITIDIGLRARDKGLTDQNMQLTDLGQAVRDYLKGQPC